jgi:hypothetical protein
MSQRKMINAFSLFRHKKGWGVKAIPEVRKNINKILIGSK